MKKFKKFNSIDILAKVEVFETLNFGHILYAFKTVVFGLSTASLLLIIEFVYNYFISKFKTFDVFIPEMSFCVEESEQNSRRLSIDSDIDIDLSTMLTTY